MNLAIKHERVESSAGYADGTIQAEKEVQNYRQREYRETRKAIDLWLMLFHCSDFSIPLGMHLTH